MNGTPMLKCLMDRDGGSDRDDMVEWLGLAAGLHEDVVDEAKAAKPRLRMSELVYVSGLFTVLLLLGCHGRARGWPAQLRVRTAAAGMRPR